MVRPTAHLLVIVMLLASGRLLACGWECLDELAAPAQASCHQDSHPDRSGLPTVASAKVGDAMHACLPEIAQPHVTAVKLASAKALVAAPPAAPHLTAAPPFDGRHAALLLTRSESPHPSAPPILRI